jgi:hypothetical protein
MIRVLTQAHRCEVSSEQRVGDTHWGSLGLARRCGGVYAHGMASAARLLASLLLAAQLVGCPTSTQQSRDAATADAAASSDGSLADAPPGPDAGVDAFVAIDTGRPTVDLVLRSETAGAYEGETLQIRLLDTSVGTSSEWFSVVVIEGRFVLTVPGGFNRDLFGMFALLYVDLDSDRLCDEGTEDAFEHFVNNDFGSGPDESTITFAPLDTIITCDDAMSR